VCDGDTAKSRHEQRRLCAVASWPGTLIVMTDPDAGGRMLRIFLDDFFRQRRQGRGAAVLHAFVAITDAMSTAANR